MLVIDISNINFINLDEDRGKIKIGSGVKNEQLYKVLTSKGYPFPGGTCPTVGVSGYTLGGGWGLSCRKYGLGCDSLIEVELINYEGKLVKANSYCNYDLFWALRGSGGGNYGVVVSLTYSIPKEKVDNVSLFSIYYPNSSLDIQYEFFNKWQDWIDRGSTNINMRAGIYNDIKEGIYIYTGGLSYLNPHETELNLKPFLDISTAQLNIEYIPLQEAIEKIESSYAPYEYFKSAGRFVNKSINNTDIEGLLNLINNERPQGSYLTAINMYGLGGKVSDVENGETAFFYRDSKYILYIQTIFESIDFLEVNNDWVIDNYPSLKNITCGSYINFPYQYIEYPLHEYYGENANLIKKVKRRYDPYNVFSFPQGINTRTL